MDEEELQEADVLWPWPDTPPPSPEEEENYHQLPGVLPVPELYGYDAGDFSCEPFSGPPVSSISSLTSSAQWSKSAGLSSDGFFLSGPSSAGSAGLIGLDGTEEFLEADVLWPDTDDDEDGGGAAGFWWFCCHRVEEAASVAGAAAAVCGERQAGWRPSVSSPIDIPMATRGSSAAARRRRPSPLAAAVLARRRR